MKNNLRSSFDRRQYMRSEDFEIFYYSDTHFMSVSLHTHSYYEIYLFAEGSVSMRIGDIDTVLRKGDIILIPPGIPHRAIIHDPDCTYRRFVFWISESYMETLLAESEDYKVIINTATENHIYIHHFDQGTYHFIRSKFIHLLEEVHSDRFGKQTAVNLALRELLLSINRSVNENNYPVSPAGLSEKLSGYIEVHLEDNLSLERLAKEFFVSKFHISHLFKEEFGVSLHQYILKKRLGACREAMIAGGRITEIYSEFGFQNYSSFYRSFRREYEMSPAEYQRMYRLKHASYSQDHPVDFASKG